ncbi:toxic anion resistance protein [Ostreibacterium oceani]|uniref:Toxic anion resistance protein n=1 Tax=Ostreibacterium oceani TaxID=2654998 RepID=A0A6N7EXU8_9GAMM|nr:toxic anion resistance protein [Ostreibacterium oceani]MPV86415.1 toxic anion resistance protein [Ostreibacterium oceani]
MNETLDTTKIAVDNLQAEVEAIVENDTTGTVVTTKALVPAKEALPAAEYEAELDKAIADLDDFSINNIIYFGAKAQEEVTQISDQMLNGVKSKDAGPAGAMLSEMVSVLRGFDMDKLNPNKKQSLWDKILFRAKPIVKFQQRYDAVGEQVETIANSLEKHKETLLHDIKSLDKLYDANLAYFHNLEFYIDAGERKLAQLDDVDIPALATQAETSDEMLDAQKLKDLRALRDDLARRVHDLRLTRQVVMQSLPSIRMVQNNDKGLVTKINSTLVNTIPLWRQQLAQAITIFRSNEAAGTLKAASDLTNDLLEANAENLKQANTLAREQIERGIFDIESVKKANDTLIQTIEESLKITEAGKKARSEAVVTLAQAESDLKQALRAASLKASQAAPEAATENTAASTTEKA